MSEQGERLIRLRQAMGIPTQTAMAAALGIEVSRWNNFERGQPISKEIAFKVRLRFPGVTTDWLFFGDPSGLPLELAKRLGELPNEAPGSKRRR
jgi:transcriptional regulator with XRE-family HTH domain